jgi:hypothetical protein
MNPLGECIRSLALAAGFDYVHGLRFMEESINKFIKSAGRRNNESRIAALDELAGAVKSKALPEQFKELASDYIVQQRNRLATD